MSIKAVLAAAALLAAPALLATSVSAADYNGDRGDRNYSRDRDDDDDNFRRGGGRPQVVIVQPPRRDYDNRHGYNDRWEGRPNFRRHRFGHGRPWWARHPRFADRYYAPYPRRDW